jgi:hypothetical protein
VSLRKGGNLFVFAQSRLALGDWFDAVGSVRLRADADGTALSVHRAYAKATLLNFSFETGLDNVQLGPGKWGLLLSRNTDPYPLVKLQTEEPIRFFGEWRFVVMGGWLTERRRDVSDPRVMGIRVSWEIFHVWETGINRTTLWGGRGRPSYHFWEWPKVIVGTNENVPGSRFDNDAYFSYDFTLHVPFYKLTPVMRTFDLYWQGAGTDTNVPWQKEDSWSSSPPFGVKLLERAFQLGLLVEVARTRIQIEYAVMAFSFFDHHIYDVEGFSYHGLSLGYPFGGNLQSLYAELEQAFGDDLTVGLQGGVRQSPCFDRIDQRRDYFATLRPVFGDDVGERRIWFALEASRSFPFTAARSFRLGGYFRFEATRNWDADPLPAQFAVVRENRRLMTFGVLLSFEPDFYVF